MYKDAIFAQVAKAKLVYIKDKDNYKIIMAFNVYPKQNERGDIVYPFPPQAKCDFVSGDIPYDTLEQDKTRIIEQAKQVLRTNNIEFV
jgi:hypothetical protein